MATKKKELLEQENSAPETTVPVENTPSPDETQAAMAAPADGGDLNELLASMDQPDEDAAPGADGSSLPELTEKMCIRDRGRTQAYWQDHRCHHHSASAAGPVYPDAARAYFWRLDQRFFSGGLC